MECQILLTCFGESVYNELAQQNFEQSLASAKSVRVTSTPGSWSISVNAGSPCPEATSSTRQF